MSRLKVALAASFLLLSCGGKTEDNGLIDDDDDGVTGKAGDGDGDGDTATGGDSQGGGGSQGDGGNTGGSPTGGSSENSGGRTGGSDAGGSGGSTRDPATCENFDALPGVAAIYDRTGAEEASSDNLAFFDYPWPELTRPLSNWATLPNPDLADGCEPQSNGEVVDLLTSSISPPEYRDYLFHLAGNNLQQPASHPVLYLQFDGAIGEDRLPSPIESVSRDAAVFLINVDGESPALGQHVPIETRVFHDSYYLPDNTLAVMPTVGFPLDPDTRYALVVLKSLGDSSGEPLGASAEFQALKGEDGCPGAVPGYAAAFDELEELPSFSPDQVAAMILFESGDPAATLKTIATGLNEFPQANEVAQVSFAGPATLPADSSFHVLEGSFQTLIQQQGTPPFLPKIDLQLLSQTVTVSFDSETLEGSFLGEEFAQEAGTGAGDRPRTEAIPFTLTVPDTALGDSSLSLPLVIYGPGTGGSRFTPIQNGVAGVLSQLGYAVLTVDPVMHAERAHSENIDPDLLDQLATADGLAGSSYQAQIISLVESGDLFFNPLQLQAAKGNILQGAVDYLWQASVFSQIRASANIGGEDRSLAFSDVSFFGHSQGGSIGPLLARSQNIQASLLSGASGHIPSILLNKTKPSDTIAISPMLGFLTCDNPAESLDAFHPMMAVIGHFFEDADGEHYAGLLTDPEEGMSLFMIKGLDDHYSPPLGNEALSTAAGLHEIESSASASAPALAGQALLDVFSPRAGYGVPSTSVQANAGAFTAGFKQYSGVDCTDGHFVFACNTEAVGDWEAFFASALDGVPVIR